MPFLARLTLMFWLGLIVYTLLRFQASDEASLYKQVSWNEFVHNMLAKGEVKLNISLSVVCNISTSSVA